MKGFEEVFIVAWIVFGLYMLVFMVVGADLWSGVRKAKRRGEVRSSYGFKRTVDKMTACRWEVFGTLMATTAIISRSSLS